MILSGGDFVRVDYVLDSLISPVGTAATTFCFASHFWTAFNCCIFRRHIFHVSR